MEIKNIKWYIINYFYVIINICIMLIGITVHRAIRITQYFGYKEEEKGYYAGLIASGLFIGRISSRFVMVYI